MIHTERASCTHIHGVPSGRDLASMTLDQSPVQRVGERVLAHVGEELLVNLESGEVGRSGDGIHRVGRDGLGLVALGVNEVVVEDLNVGVVAGQLHDLVGDRLGIGKGGHILADTSEAEDDILGVGTAKLGSGLLTKNDEVGGARSDVAADPSRQTRVNTTAETLVGAADDVEGLLALGLQGLGLGGIVDLVGRLAVADGVAHGALGAGQLGGGDNLHGLGDLLDVANRLETALDLTEGGVGGSVAGGAAWREQVSLASWCVGFLAGPLLRDRVIAPAPAPPLAPLLLLVPLPRHRYRRGAGRGGMRAGWAGLERSDFGRTGQE